MFPYILVDENTLTLVLNNKHHMLTKTTHPNFDKIVQAIKDDDQAAAEDLVDITKKIAAYAHGNLVVKDGDVYWEGRPFHNALTDRLLKMLEGDFPVEPLVHFLHNLKRNPSKRAVDELYGFLEVGNLPITSDGHFLAYKKVTNHYKDIYTGKIDNSVGAVCQMARNEVDEDKDMTCSQGLHFCSIDYLPHFGASRGDRVVIVKINPADVVAIPADYENTKGRTCRYEVVGEHDWEGTGRSEAFDDVVDDSWSTDADEEFEDDDLDDSEPRRVYEDVDGRYRYGDNGQYASYDAYKEYSNWIDRRWTS